MVGSLSTNYGVVGDTYRSYLLDNYPSVIELVDKCKAKITEKTEADISERFWVATAAALLAGGTIANELGLTKIDLQGFLDWLVKEFRRNRVEQVQDFAPTEERAHNFLFQFCHEHREAVAFVDHVPAESNGFNVGTVYTSPPMRGGILGVVAKRDRILRVKKQEFTVWLYKAYKETPSKHIKALISQGAKELRASLTAGMTNQLSGEHNVIDIPIDAKTFGEMDELFEEP
jgi:hypothetical protein